MKNFIFISPNFPKNYYRFCRELNNDGLRVLGIGDQSYQELHPDLISSLTEYYKVSSLENYDEVFKAVAFFSFKYGKIDFIESNNEYWLERDARLRTDFNVRTSFQTGDMPRVKYKSKMKACYKRAGVKTARYTLLTSLRKAKKFISEVGYPVIVKPDNGVGAISTYKINGDDDLKGFIDRTPDYKRYIMEEFIEGEVCSYDAIIDSKGNPLFETGNCTVSSIMDVVNTSSDSLFFINAEVADDVRKLGRACVKSFGVRSRFIHFEFFRLQKNQKGVGKKGDLLGLEVNMRPSGGISPDMMNFANSIDVYKVYADMIAFDKTDLKPGERNYCAFIGRRDQKAYKLSDMEVKSLYYEHLKMAERVPEALSGAMGNMMFVATFKTLEEVRAFYGALMA